MRSLLRFSLAITLLLATAAPFGARAAAENPAADPSAAPEVWMAVLPADVLVAPGAEWDYIKNNVDGIKFWTQQIDLPAEQWPFQGGVPAPGALERLIETLNANKIDLVIEKGLWPQPESRPEWDGMGGVGGPFDETYAQRAADNEIARLRRVEALGGKVAALDVDGPIRHMTHPVTGLPGIGSMEAAADNFVKYMLLIHEQFPDLRFYALSNFPNFGYRGDLAYWGTKGWGDYFTAMQAIVEKAQAAGAPLTGFTVDNPYDYAIGEHASPGLENPGRIDWMGRILDVERYVHEHGLEFNLIVNSERAGNSDMAAYCRETLAFIDAYRARGGRPDRWIVQSWYTHPLRTEVLPESNPESFTGLTKAVIEKVRTPPPTVGAGQ